VDQVGQAEECNTSIADVLRAADAWSAEVAVSYDEMTAHDLRGIVDQVDMLNDRLRTRIDLHRLLGSGLPCKPLIASFEVPFQKHQNGRAKPIIKVRESAPQPDLIALVADASRWADELPSGKTSSIQQITERQGLLSGTVSRILTPACLAPDLSTAILESHQPSHLSAKSLRDLPDLPLAREEQRQVLGLPNP